MVESETHRAETEPLTAGEELDAVHRERLSAFFISAQEDELRRIAAAFAESAGKTDLSQTVLLEQQCVLEVKFAQAHSVTFELSKNGMDIGSMILQRDDLDDFRISHRYVRPERRGESGGSILLYAVETFVRAVPFGKAKKNVYAKVGQLNVIDWFLHRGFHPKDPEALADIRQKIDRGEIIAGYEGWLYKEGTTPSEQNLGHTNPDFAISTVVEKALEEQSSLQSSLPLTSNNHGINAKPLKLAMVKLTSLDDKVKGWLAMATRRKSLEELLPMLIGMGVRTILNDEGIAFPDGVNALEFFPKVRAEIRKRLGMPSLPSSSRAKSRRRRISGIDSYGKPAS